jgi:hypothetical protein
MCFWIEDDESAAAAENSGEAVDALVVARANNGLAHVRANLNDRSKTISRALLLPWGDRRDVSVPRRRD